MKAASFLLAAATVSACHVDNTHWAFDHDGGVDDDYAGGGGTGGSPDAGGAASSDVVGDALVAFFDAEEDEGLNLEQASSSWSFGSGLAVMVDVQVHTSCPGGTLHCARVHAKRGNLDQDIVFEVEPGGNYVYVLQGAVGQDDDLVFDADAMVPPPGFGQSSLTYRSDIVDPYGFIDDSGFHPFAAGPSVFSANVTLARMWGEELISLERADPFAEGRRYAVVVSGVGVGHSFMRCWFGATADCDGFSWSDEGNGR